MALTEIFKANLFNMQREPPHNSHVRARQRHRADCRRADLLADLADQLYETASNHPKREELSDVLRGIADGLLNWDDPYQVEDNVAYNLGHSLGKMGIR